MTLFQKSVIKKHLASLDDKKVEVAWNIFSTHFLDPAKQANIHNSKEEQYQEGFLRDLFVKVFGYVLNPSPGYNLTTELKNIGNAKKADGGILQGDKVLGIIELKGTDTVDLGKVEPQAFGYKSHQKGCRYVIISNFAKLRLYIDDATTHVEFDIFQMTPERFRLLYLLLLAENLFAGLPARIRQESALVEEDITKNFYKDYSAFKTALFEDLRKRNQLPADLLPADLPNFENLANLTPADWQLLLFKKSQKLLDRLLFIFFGEDKGLLPPNLIKKTIDDWDRLRDLDEYRPLYEQFKKYFGYINEGAQRKDFSIFAYNGGLFEPDEVLDSVKISDDVLWKYTQEISRYDFESEVDVNILGHIFEHSLNEIEEITAQLEGTDFDKTQTKRKKDGVFYTPRYITQYIVENTVGRLCEEKKTELTIDAIDFTKDYRTKRTRTTKDGKKTNLSAEGEILLDTITGYREWLFGLTICDPACGSGAFLNQAFEFLIDEHELVDEMEAKLRGETLAIDGRFLSDVTDDILEKNLYGVDINEEAVEIARLSLWLRSAAPGRKLTDLSGHIKCGNSLIDDPAIAGEKAFAWEAAFPEVFEQGGFDVVIGNPPYGAEMSNHIEFLKMRYSSFSGRGESYVLFIERCTHILAIDGNLGLIVPDTYLNLGFTQPLREYILQNTEVKNIIVLPANVFESATVDTTIIIASKKNKTKTFHKCNVDVQKVNKKSSAIEWQGNIKHIKISTSIWHEEKSFLVSSNQSEIEIMRKVDNSFDSLDLYAEMFSGIKCYEVGKGKPKQTPYIRDKKPYTSELKIDDTWDEFFDGKHIDRYLTTWKENNWIKYGEWLAAPRDIENFAGEKILIRKIIGNKLKSHYVEKTSYCNTLLFVLKLKKDVSLNYHVVLGILNSSFIAWYFRKKFQISEDDTFPQIMIRDILQFPIPIPKIENQNHLKELAIDIILNNKNLIALTSQFTRLLTRRFSLPKLSKKLQNWPELDYADFAKELNKLLNKEHKRKLTLEEDMEWEPLFEKQKAEANSLQAEIDKTDRKIDALVYELYGLTEEEIAIIEQ